jgi:hypothetical protein
MIDISACELFRNSIYEELHNLYSSPSIIRMMKSRSMRWAGHIVRMRENRNGCRILVGKPGEKRPLRRLRRRWVDNIKMDQREKGSIKCWEILECLQNCRLLKKGSGPWS